ncbi:MAG TPA: hypothetical protein VNH82_01225 [Candidatus Dormibacteraeota bacterium]|nr:hypothetical protein [Candidatus Dormibacteraeota bacterium]
MRAEAMVWAERQYSHIDITNLAEFGGHEWRQISTRRAYPNYGHRLLPLRPTLGDLTRQSTAVFRPLVKAVKAPGQLDDLLEKRNRKRGDVR